jgi:hypothetical protein
VSEAKTEAIAALWRLSRAEADELRARIALLERAVMRAMAGQAVSGTEAEWQAELAGAEAEAAEAAARTVRLAALIEGRAA